MTDEIKNFESELSMNENVQIINGFYNKNYGTIQSYNIKTKEYTVEIIINNVKKKILCELKDLRKVKKLGIFGL